MSQTQSKDNNPKLIVLSRDAVLVHRLMVAKKEILEQVMAGMVNPDKVTCFGDLNDFGVDANEYVIDSHRDDNYFDMLYDASNWGQTEMLDYYYEITQAITDWITKGGLYDGRGLPANFH